MKSPYIIICALLICATNCIAGHKPILRVCTAGDYPPLTLLKHGKYSGIAITNARNLAKYLNMQVNFVKITWPTLSQTLLANKCDIAMGGVSYTKQRAQQFLVTKPVLTFGKVPLIRCNDKNKYKNISDIDQKSVRVVENAGGTNYTFAKSHLKRATIIVVQKNNQTLKYLLANKADVMITDNIEAKYRAQLYPQLCVVNPNQLLTHSQKIYLLPKNQVKLLKRVNQWITANLKP